MRCKATNKMGNPCRCQALKDEEYCIAHSQSPRAEEGRLRAAYVRREIYKQSSMGKLILLQRQWKKLKSDRGVCTVEKAKTMCALSNAMVKLERQIKTESDRENKF